MSALLDDKDGYRDAQFCARKFGIHVRTWKRRVLKGLAPRPAGYFGSTKLMWRLSDLLEWEKAQLVQTESAWSQNLLVENDDSGGDE